MEAALRRNWDCIRDVLQTAALTKNGGYFKPIEIVGYSEEIASRHIELAEQAGFIVKGLTHYMREHDGGNTLLACHAGLTWRGREFLGLIQDDDTWMEIKRVAADKDIPLIEETIKIIGVEIIRRRLERPKEIGFGERG